ncbi:MAG: ADP-ribosylglycohydrolase family protein [Candidatus Competibacteraceae bacterium]|nr:ADP-ribosylglycohydrolase family protein [Candidatus Competibacteraceae bacterium]
MDILNRFRGSLLGLAAGDAVGVTLEFKPRGSFTPITDMVGGGPFRLQPGQWTDDTSMALCLATSLIECQRFDAKDQMDRYVRWWRQGDLSSTGHCFDIGVATAKALRHYEQTGNPYAGSTDPYSAGNGCIMRLAPIPMFFSGDIDAVERYAAESSRTTHGAAECIDACRLFAWMLTQALNGQPRDQILFGAAHAFIGSEKIVAIARGNWRGKPVSAIWGSGYVVESLEAALWAFATTENFEDAILTAANLGDDADTTAAICGQIAGAYYGETGVPAHWLEKLAMRETIAGLADGLCAVAQQHKP